jgi:hypothetical protein
MQHTQEQNARRLTRANRGETGIGATLMTSCEGGGAIRWPCRIVITNGTTVRLSTIQITTHMCYNYAISINQLKPLVSG